MGDFTQGGFAAIDKRFADPAGLDRADPPRGQLAAGTKPVAVVSFPADLASRLGTGWTVALQDTLGEFQLGILLRVAGGASADASSKAAAGWGGDRVALIEGPGGASGVVLDTTWDDDHGRDGVRGGARWRGREAQGGRPRGHGAQPGAGPGGADHRGVGRDALPGRERAGARGRVSPGGPISAGRAPYIDSGAEIPSSTSAFASVVFVASASASRFADRSGSAVSTTRASR